MLQNKISKKTTVDIIYPIGSVYISLNAANPAELFGGTWERIQDRFLLAAGTSYNNGTIGGSATHTPSGILSGGAVGNHTLTVAETPAHTHTRGTMNITGTASASYEGSGQFTSQASGAFYIASDKAYWGWGTTGPDNDNKGLGFDASRSWTGETSSIGGNSAHNHPFTQPIFTGISQNTMPPYLTVYMWKRVG